MADTDTDVIVVGAGPTGLTLACSLRLHGLSVRVVDRAPRPATTSRANFLHARGSEVLGRIGALGDLPNQSLRAMRITNYLGDRPVMTLEFGDPGKGTAAPPMVVSQAKVEAALRDRLAQLGVQPEWGRALVGMRQEDGSVVAELGDGAQIRAQWMVGCDGSTSVTRQQVGIAFPGVRRLEPGRPPVQPGPRQAPACPELGAYVPDGDLPTVSVVGAARAKARREAR